MSINTLDEYTEHYITPTLATYHKHARTPEQENHRLQALQEYNIVNTSPEADYDNIVDLASQLFNAPTVFISFVTQDKIWVKSSRNFDLQNIPRHNTPCELAITQSSPIFELHDVQNHECFQNLEINPAYYTYIGALLYSKDGEILGVLGMFFHKETSLNKDQRKHLFTLKRQVESLLEQRRTMSMFKRQQDALERLISQQEEVLSMISHDTRNLLAGMLSNCEFALGQMEQQSGDAREAIEDALDAAQRARQMLHHVEQARQNIKSEALQATSPIREDA